MSVHPRHLVALVLCCLAMCQQSAAGPRPLIHVMADGQVPHVSLSPDGKHFAMRAGQSDAAGLVIVEIESGQTVNAFATRFDRPLYYFRWISSETLIYAVGRRGASAEAQAAAGALLMIGIYGDRPRTLLSYRSTIEPRGRMTGIWQGAFMLGEVISTLPKETGYVLLAETPIRARGAHWSADHGRLMRIRKLNVSRGRTTPVETVPLVNASLLVDADGEPRFALGLDRRGTAAAASKLDAGGSWKSFALAGFTEVVGVPQRLPATGKVSFLGRKEGAARNGLYRIDLGSGAVVLEYMHEGLDIEAAVHDFSGQEVIGVRLEGPRLAVHWLDPEHSAVALHQGLMRAFSQMDVRVVSVAPEARRAIIAVRAEDGSGEFFLLDTQTLQARLIVSLLRIEDPA